MDELRITNVDLGDDDAVITWNEVLRAGYAAGREAVWWRSPEASIAQFRSPRPGRRFFALLATLDSVPVGAAEAHADPGQPAEVEVTVLPAWRRRGFGTQLAATLFTAMTGWTDLVFTETYSEAGVAFAERHGLEIGIREVRQLLDLPVRPTALDDAAGTPRPDIEVRSWVGSCPDDLVDDWTALRRQMDADVPMGDLTRSSTRPSDIREVRANEERLLERGYELVRSLALIDGRGVGYTEIQVSRHEPEIALQDDTLVDRAFRGRGVGRALKVANLRQLSALADSWQSRWLQTWVAVENTPMLALNHAFGFRNVDLLRILEGPLPSVDDLL